jgi:hypothetical protein
MQKKVDRLCGLAVRVPGYRSRGPGFDSRRYQVFWEVVGLERGPLNLVSTTEKLLERKSSSPGLENREYGRRDPSHCPRNTVSKKLALTSPTSGGRAAVMVRSRTKPRSYYYYYENKRDTAFQFRAYFMSSVHKNALTPTKSYKKCTSLQGLIQYLNKE